MTKIVVRPASAKQIAFIVRLSDERVAPAKPHTDDVQSYFRVISAARSGKSTLSSKMASAAIEFLLTLPKKEAALPKGEKQAAQPGYYFRDGKVYVVVASKNNPGRFYAKELVVPTDGRARASWNYAPGIHKHLRDSERLTAQQAASLGHQHGYCMVCGRRLDDPRSVQDGIGPVCIKRLGGTPSKSVPSFKVGTKVFDAEGWEATVIAVGRKYLTLDYGQGWDPAKVDASSVTVA